MRLLRLLGRGLLRLLGVGLTDEPPAGNTVRLESPAEFRETVKRDRARWAELVRAIHTVAEGGTLLDERLDPLVCTRAGRALEGPIHAMF